MSKKDYEAAARIIQDIGARADTPTDGIEEAQDSPKFDNPAPCSLVGPRRCIGCVCCAVPADQGSDYCACCIEEDQRQ